MHWLDPGLDHEAPVSGRAPARDFFRNVLPFPKRALAAAILAAPLAVTLVLMAAPFEYRASARIAIDLPAAEAAFPLWPEVRRMASRDLGRRAVAALRLESRPEFDPMAGFNPLRRARVGLGLAPDPARLDREERILKAYEDRLGVRAIEPAGHIEIAFRSRDRAFAAAAANTIARLFLDLRAEAGADAAGERPAPAMLVSPAVTPVRPILPPARLLLAVAAGASLVAALTFGGFGHQRRRRPDIEEPPEPPRAVGDPPVFVRLSVRRPAPQGGQTVESRRAADDDAEALDEVAARLMAGRRDGRALRLVGAGLAPGEAASGLILALARRLGNEGRSILIRLDDAGRDETGAGAGVDAPGLRDILAATASFDEAIRRDPHSRLHLMSGGRGDGPIDRPDLAGALDALAGAYDFIWLAAPDLEAGEMALTLAADADFFLLAAPPQPRGGAVARAEAALRAAGARDVLVVGAPAPARAARLGQDAA